MVVARAKRLSVAAVAGLLLVAAAATAQTPQERRWCEGEEAATADQRIAGCSAVIKAGREKSDQLAEAFNNRGIAYRLKGDYERALQDYGQAIKLNPKFAVAFVNRGVAYDKKGDYDRAIQDFDQAIKLKPSVEAHFNRGNARLAKSQYDHAIDDYNQAIKLKADFAPAFDNRCWARAVVGILDSRGFVFLKMTQFDAAVSDYEAALRIDPKLAFALYGRGLARLRNDDSTGEADITAAKALQADIAEEYARYGVQDAR